MVSVKENKEDYILKNIIQMYDLDFEEMTVGFHKGIPFTGFTFSMYPATGELELLTPFKDGFEDGICREWYENGQLKKVKEMIRGQSNGYEICWYPNGKLESESQYMEGFVIYKKVFDQEGAIIENKVFKDNIDIYRTWDKKGMTRYRNKTFSAFKNDKFTDGIYKLLIEKEHDKTTDLNKQDYEYEKRILEEKSQKILHYIESNIDVIYERETRYKNIIKKENLEISEKQVLYNDCLFTGLAYDMPFIEEIGSYVLLSIYTYKEGYIHGNCLEWYSEGVVRPENIVKEGCCDDGEYWCSKGFLKKYAYYDTGKELEYKEWDELGNIVAERMSY